MSSHVRGSSAVAASLLVALLLALAGLVPARCGGRGVPFPLGRLREVTVISREIALVRPVIDSLLGRELLTPQPEPEFRVRVGKYDRFEDFSRMRVVLLVGTVGDSVVAGILGPRRDSLPAGEFGLFKFPNAWASNQWVLVLAARDSAALLSGLRAYARRIHEELAGIVQNQLTEATYHLPLNQKMTGEMATRYGFSLDVPRGWQLATRFDQERFVYLFGHYPDRSVFVYWADTAQSARLDSLVALRNRLTARFYDGDSVDTVIPVSVDSLVFLDRPALRLRGIWQNRKNSIGGPFVSYVFRYQGRLFYIDGTLYNPGEKKLDNLFQLEAIIRTFTPR
jgi:hypothetical protein